MSGHEKIRAAGLISAMSTYMSTATALFAKHVRWLKTACEHALSWLQIEAREQIIRDKELTDEFDWRTLPEMTLKGMCNLLGQ